jgi:biopolymer transport protein ExbD
VKFHSTEQEDVSLDLAPLIDVVFLLLIFFMVTTSFTQNDAIDLTLPEADSQQVQHQEYTINITISKLDEIIVESDQARFSEISGSENRKALSQKIKQAIELLEKENPDRSGTSPTIIIEADRTASHGRVIELMDVISQLGINKIQFAVVPVQEASANPE